MRSATIKAVANGYVVSWEEEYRDSHEHAHYTEEYVFEDADIDGCAKRNLIAALYTVLDRLGVYVTAKEHRIRITCGCQGEG